MTRGWMGGRGQFDAGDEDYQPSEAEQLAETIWYIKTNQMESPQSKREFVKWAVEHVLKAAPAGGERPFAEQLIDLSDKFCAPEPPQGDGKPEERVLQLMEKAYLLRAERDAAKEKGVDVDEMRKGASAPDETRAGTDWALKAAEEIAAKFQDTPVPIYVPWIAELIKEAAAPSEAVRVGWVSAKELPEIDMPVWAQARQILTTDVLSQFPQYCVARWHGDRWQANLLGLQWQEITTYKVTQWRELPEPPVARGREGAGG